MSYCEHQGKLDRTLKRLKETKSSPFCQSLEVLELDPVCCGKYPINLNRIDYILNKKTLFFENRAQFVLLLDVTNATHNSFTSTSRCCSEQIETKR